MEIDELREQIRVKYEFSHVVSEAMMLDDDFYSVDGINDSSIIYVAARISEGKILRHAIYDFCGVILTSSNPPAVGTISELRALGVSWQEIFAEASCWGAPRARTVEDFV